MSKEFLGPIDSHQKYFLPPLENQLATVLTVGQAANQTQHTTHASWLTEHAIDTDCCAQHNSTVLYRLGAG